MSDNALQISPAPGVELALSLCGEDGIEFKGQRYVPDSTKGFFKFAFSHAFPVQTLYQTALYPAVIAKSFNSLQFQNVNYEHQIASYHDGKDVRDRVIGSVVAVDFPQEPFGGWKVTADAAKSPGITGIAAVYKQTQGMAKILGEHSAGRKNYTVSMEVIYPLDEAGFAVALNGKDPKFDFSPPDMLAAGYEYIPYDKAPGELIACYSIKKSRVMTQWQGRKVTVMMGGLNNPVHYAGAGVVAYGAEPPAKILRLAATGDIASILSTLADSFCRVFTTVVKNSVDKSHHVVSAVDK